MTSGRQELVAKTANAVLDPPAYAVEDHARLGTAELIQLMQVAEDRLPRAVIDTCAARGDEMVRVLQQLSDHPWVEQEVLGAWWLRLHAVMILGLVPSEQAGLLLVRFMRCMAEADDANLQDWLASYWPALFANKPDSVLPALRELSGNRELDWYIRANAVDPVVAAAVSRGEVALDETLAWVAGIAADEGEDWSMRLMCGNVLLDFPRDAHRALVEDLADRQKGFGVHFGRSDVKKAYAAGKDEPDWRSRDDPWRFYRPEEIARRQARWAEEDGRGDDKTEYRDLPFGETPTSFLRPTFKVGRNDPCPCGSGKKFKKCCL